MFLCAGSPVLFRVKTGVVPADDLLGEIPLQALGAQIPIQDLSLRVLGENRVVPDAFHLDAKQFLAGAKTHLNLLLERYVADKGKHEKAACGLQKIREISSGNSFRPGDSRPNPAAPPSA